ncbi:protein spaetzle 5 [Uranotaenia lowii]|uniref:protein spaetzle 5 n=1 Tax=Uranotaenia lowii TaxID=190385 RepID=UPI002479DAAD|nr:protein spaetzle 5 [Uranotaenia lowii]XP_055609833.1 protein spaetzle 5 [Uranotaenia lowii]
MLITCTFITLATVMQLVNSSYPAARYSPQQQKKCGAYGQAPCTYIPAPRGMTPKCASPGKTFCEHNADYPTELIRELLEKFNLHRVLANEERIQYHAQNQGHYYYGPEMSYSPKFAAASYYRKPSSSSYEGYSYDHPKRSFQLNEIFAEKRPVPQPIYIPKPQHSFNYNAFVRPPSTSSTQYSPAEWLKRFARDLIDRSDFRQATPAPFRFSPDPAEPPKPFRLAFPAAAFGLLLMNETTFTGSLAKLREKRQAISPADRIDLCEYREMYVTPQAALNTKGNWMYVVNHEDSRQLVKSEICLSNQCSNLCNLPSGYRSRCEQKFSQKRLLTLDEDGGSLYVDTYWFPSCCVCSLANDIN